MLTTSIDGSVGDPVDMWRSANQGLVEFQNVFGFLLFRGRTRADTPDNTGVPEEESKGKRGKHRCEREKNES